MIAALIALMLFPQGAAQKPAPRQIQLVAYATFPGGERRPVGIVLVTDPSGGSGNWYFHARPTVCEAVGSSQAPAADAYGWKVEVVPGPGADSVRVKWERLPAAAASVGDNSGIQTIRLNAAGSAPIPIDRMDGDSRLAARRRLKALRALDPLSAEAGRIPELQDAQNVRLVNLRVQIREKEDRLGQLSQRYGERHPEVLKAQAEVASVKKQYGDEKFRLLAQLIQQYEEGLIPLKPVNGCDAVSYSIEAQVIPARDPRQAVEAELWFVHKAPDGKETSQRQAVRIRHGGRGDFYFDDMPLTLTHGEFTLPIAVEVFGTLETSGIAPDGTIDLSLQLTRRYINKETAFGSWPKTGSTVYPLTVKTGEVVSFVLPPLADDGGILLGHRFSLRMRVKPLGEDDN